MYKWVIKDHSKRGYQDKYEYLIMIPLNINNPVSVPNDIDHLERILIYDSYSFLDFFGFSGNLRAEFIKYAEMALKAINYKKLRKILKDEAKRSKKIIRKEFNYGQDDYEKDLKRLSLSYLLNYKFKEYKFKKLFEFK
ncbi:MAG: hypothetical protein ACFFAH_15820 [Promethearchaeota archaeon]